MKTVQTYKGLKLYSFQGIPHLARKDIYKCHGRCVKQTNGRYYMPLTKYMWGRRSYWISCFRMAAWQIIHIARRQRETLRLAVDQLIQKRRKIRLLQDLKKLDFERVLLRSDFYERIKQRLRERRSCQRCGSLQTEFHKGPCLCHLCEDWFGCSSGSTRAPVDRVCLQCGHSQRMNETWD